MKPRVIALAALAFVILVGAGVMLSLALKPGQAVPATPTGQAAITRAFNAPVARPAPNQPATDSTPASLAGDVSTVQPDPGEPGPLPSPLPPPPTTERPPTQTDEGDSVPPSLQPPPDLSMQVESIHRDMAALARQFCGMAR